MKIIFAGTPEFAEVALRALLASSHTVVAVLTQQDKPAGRGLKMHESPVKRLALSHKLPLLQVKSLRDEAVLKQLNAFQADIMVVAAYGLILPDTVLSAFPLGCINIHGSLLPRWRGAAPIQRAILSGDKETGITIMEMEVGLDTGPMLLKQVCPIQEDDTTERLHDRLAQIGSEAIVSALDNFQDLSRELQDDTLATYAEKIKKSEANLNWSLSASELACAVRAYFPWPVAYTFCRGVRLKVLSAYATNERVAAKPGTILLANKKGIEVACGQGSLRIEAIQLPGKRALAVAEVLHANHPFLQQGECFESSDQSS
jgi:methionyl-tRNA formyltransferase